MHLSPYSSPMSMCNKLFHNSSRCSRVVPSCSRGNLHSIKSSHLLKNSFCYNNS